MSECAIESGASPASVVLPSSHGLRDSYRAPLFISLGMLAWLLGVALQLQQSRLADPEWTWMAGLLTAVLAFAVSMARRLPGQLRVAVWGVACVVAGWALSSWHAHHKAGQQVSAELSRQPQRVRGWVSNLPQYRPDGVRFELELDPESALQGGGSVRPQKLSLSWSAGWGEGFVGTDRVPRVRAGERWELWVRLKSPHALMNPHGFDRELQWFEDGIAATGSVQRGERLAEGVGDLIVRWRQMLRDALFATVSDTRVAGVLAALMVGDQAAIESQDWDIFRLTGVAHLMSISGLHVTMFAWLAAALIRWIWSRSAWATLRCPAPVAARWGGVAAAAGYALLSGWGVPAQRTTWMLVVVAVVSSWGRRWPWGWILLAAAVVVTAMDPWALLQAGFWLSFAAVALLMLGGDASTPTREPPRGEWSARWNALRAAVEQGIRAQSVATLGLAPLSLMFFHQISLIGWGANLLAIPVVTFVVTPLAMLGVVWSGCWVAAAWVMHQLLSALEALAQWPWAVAWVAASPAWAQACGLLAGILWMIRAPWALRALALLFMAPLAGWTADRPAVGEFEVLAFDVGQGTSVFLQTRHHRLLFDAGPVYSRASNAGQRVVLPTLRALGHSNLDLLVLSHRDLDHVGGAQALLADLPVGNVLSSLEDSNRLIPQIEHRGIPSLRCEAGQHWTWDDVRFEVLHPLPGHYARAIKPNAMSCVLRVSTAGASLLLTGDIERAEEARLVLDQGAGLKSSVLFVPHHGSRTSSTPEFIDAVAADVAVIQAGHQNRYGHPAPDIQQRYINAGTAIVNTIDCGAWQWRSSVAPGLATCERERRRRYWHPLPAPVISTESNDNPKKL